MKIKIDFLNIGTSIVAVPSACGQTPWSYTATYNDANQRTRSTLQDGIYWQYIYDSLGQINSAIKYTLAGISISGREYSVYQNKTGNRTTAYPFGYTGPNYYEANNLNQYTIRSRSQYDNDYFVYDADGNLLSDSTWTYTGDGETGC